MIITAFIFIMVVFGLCFAAGVYLSKRLNSGSYWMVFRKLIFTLLVLIILAGGFYYGYHKAQYTKKRVYLSSNVNSNSGTLATKDITFEYQFLDSKTIQKNATKGMTLKFAEQAKSFEGVSSIDLLVSNIIHNDPAHQNTECVIETDPKLKNQYFSLLLIYPPKTVSLDLVNQIGERLGFRVYSYDTEVPWYRAVRNNQPILFDITTTPTTSSSISISQETYTFDNVSMTEILNQFNRFGKIDNHTGVEGRFSGQLTLSSNPEDLKNELASKVGVELVPFQKKVKYFEVRKR